MSYVDWVIIIGYPLALFAIGVAIARRIEAFEPLFSVPAPVRALVGGLALGGPWVLYWEGLIGWNLTVIDPLVPLTLSMVLWLLADRVVGVVSAGRGASC